jgi:uncharacterized protein (TIGR03000 family)
MFTICLAVAIGAGQPPAAAPVVVGPVEPCAEPGWIFHIWGPYYAPLNGYGMWTIPGEPVLNGFGPGDYVPSPTLGPGPHTVPGAPAIPPSHLSRPALRPSLVRSEIRISVPAAGEIEVAGRVIPVGPGTHTFTTPELPRGDQFAYQVRLRAAGPGGPASTGSQRVVFRAGEPVTVDFAPTVERSVAGR